MKMKLRLLCFFAAAIVCLHAEEVCIKQLDIPVPTVPIKLRECRYLVSDDSLEKALVFAPPSENGHLPALKALALAYEEHFAKRGVARSAYYRIARLSLEKVDDYSEHDVTRNVRRKKSPASKLWFYIITCGEPEYGAKDLGPAPVIILMDGTIIRAKERVKPLPGMSQVPNPSPRTTPESSVPFRV